MKLLVKTNTYNLYANIILLIVFSGGLFFVLKKDISAEIQEQLNLQVQLIAEELAKGNPVNFPLTIIEKNGLPKSRYFRDTVIYDHYQKENEGYYVLTENRKIGNDKYAITVMTTYIGWDEYFKTIGFTFLTLALLLVASGFLVNFWISRKVWRPFLINLCILKKHQLSANEPLAMENSDIDEFQELNVVLLDFAERARMEYLGLQEFTENSSHELQTPISIIRSRMDHLSRLPLQADGARYVQDARDALARLSRVNKGLLLLAKLSGAQFPDEQEISLSAMLSAHINQLEDHFAARNLALKTTIEECYVKASPYLVDILLSNLLSNQLKYATGPVAEVSFSNNLLIFCNEGPSLTFPENALFTRFAKGKTSKAGIGLGLAIVKKIAMIHNWIISYEYRDGKHIFIIKIAGD